MRVRERRRGIEEVCDVVWLCSDMMVVFFFLNVGLCMMGKEERFI